MVKLTFGLLLLGAAVICGCKQSTPATTPTTTFPLTEGDTWKYQVSEYDSTNTLKFSFPETVTVGKEQIIAGETWHLISNSNLSAGDTLWYILRSDGLWQRQFASSSIPTSYTTSLKYKFPTAVNDTFNLVTDTYPPSNPTRFFNITVSTAENLSVPAGSFSCIHYQDHIQDLDQSTMKPLNDTIIEQNYISSGKGLIESVQNFLKLSGSTLSRFRDETVLQSYTPH